MMHEFADFSMLMCKCYCLSNSDTATYVNSAKHVVGEKVLAVIQVHQSGPNEYEFLFSSGIKIDAIN